MDGWVFDVPGWLKDFHDPRNWHAAMLREAQDIITILVASAVGKDPDQVTDEDIAKEREHLAYADPTKSPPPAGAETVPIQAWNGFPRAVRRRAPWKEYQITRFHTTSTLCGHSATQDGTGGHSKRQ